MLKNIHLLIILAILAGCSSGGGTTNNTNLPPSSGKGTFTGKILFKNGEPYQNGTVKATGENWETLSSTNELGEYSIEVKMEDRFIFSALSPYGDGKFYKYGTPIVTNEEETSEAYNCEYDKDIADCYEAAPVT